MNFLKILYYVIRTMIASDAYAIHTVRIFDIETDGEKVCLSSHLSSYTYNLPESVSAELNKVVNDASNKVIAQHVGQIAIYAKVK